MFKKDLTYAMAAIDGWVSDLVAPPNYATIECLQQGWGTLQKGRAMDELPLKLNGRLFKDGLGAHTPSEILIKASSPIKSFQALAGPSDNEGSRKASNRIIFTVEGGGRTRWKSAPLYASDDPEKVNVPLNGLTEFRLTANEITGALAYSHANWINPEIVLENGGRIKLGIANRTLAPTIPFSFCYGGRDSHSLLPKWKRTVRTKRISRDITEHRLTYFDARTKLECILEMQTFRGFPAVEWVVRFRNTGKKDSPVISDVQALDLGWLASGAPVLRYANGSSAQIDDFMPHEAPLALVGKVSLASEGGRSSSGTMPFFNVMGEGEGFIAAIGWSGQWAAEISYDKSLMVTARAGMQKTHLKLHAGEEIRTPRMLILYWKGEAIEGHNMLRQFLLKHHTYRPDGKTIPAPLTMGAWGGVNTEQHLMRIRAVKENELKYDYYWIDAGWFGDGERYLPSEADSDWGRHVGNWQANALAHPDGMRPIADAAKKAGMKFLLWVEPERAVCGSPLANEHPEWFLGERKPGNNLLFNLGIPEARKWMTDFISGLIEKYDIGCFRQDFNMPPLEFWRNADTPKRQGISEIRHIEGLYEFWDELLRRHKGLIIDNCASGGRRLDLETTGRSIPLHRTDYPGTPNPIPIGPQAQTFGLAYWIPCNGSGAFSPGNTYNIRSALTAAMIFPFVVSERESVAPDFPWKWHHKMMADLRRAIPCYLGDFYPLSGHSISQTEWLAYQMHRPDQDEGLVLAFRREKADFESASFRLRGLAPASMYVVDDADSGRSKKMSGKKLAESGLTVSTTGRRESRLIFYRRNS